MDIRADIDGRELAFKEGLSVLEALRSAGIALPPTLCHDPRLAPAGLCFSCSVEVAAAPDQPFVARPSCREPLRAGMRVRTRSPELDAFRANLLGQLATRMADDEAARFAGRDLPRALADAGIAPAAEAPREASDDSHPYLRVAMQRCIACLRCVRICDELQGEQIWHVFGRGADLRIGTGNGRSLLDSGCVGCGACADACPTAALTDALSWSAPAAQRWTRTVCGYCAVGCEFEVGSADDRIVATRPALDGPANRGHACVKGRYAHAYVDAADRVTTPMLREAGAWRRVSWEEAITACAERLRGIIVRHGPDALGVLGSARGTNEEAYLAQKFARAVIGTHNVDCCARVCHAPTAAAMKQVLGTGAATNSFADIERAGAFLLVGANPSANHPVVAARIRQRVRQGARLVVIDPRRTPLAEIADVHLALRAGSNIPLLHALAHVLLAEDLVDADFLAQRVEGLDVFRAAVEAWTPARAAALCGVAADDIVQAARLYGGTRPAMCIHGLGVTEHGQGSEGVMALINLALLTGNLGRRGAGINPLRGQNNVQGVATMGCEPDNLTGGARIADARARFEAALGTPLPERPGLNAMAMIDAAAEGRLQGLHVIGFDLLASLPQAQVTRRALAKLELLIVQDLYLNETAREFAHVFLPAASNFEKDGTFMNSERRIQRIRRVLAPRGEARDDGEILRRLAAAMGRAAVIPDADPETVWNEIRALWPAAAGISYARLERGGLQWPCRSETDPGLEVLHATAFAHGQKARLRPVEHRPSPETVDADYPLLLSSGRDLHQFNVGTMSGRTDQQRLRPTDTLDMNPQDAADLGLADGSEVRVESRYGSARLPLRITTMVRPGQLFVTFHDPARAVNALTGPQRDAITATPEYKLTAVRVAAADPGQA